MPGSSKLRFTMNNIVLNLPTFGFVVATRAALGVGIGLLPSLGEPDGADDGAIPEEDLELARPMTAPFPQRRSICAYMRSEYGWPRRAGGDTIWL